MWEWLKRKRKSKTFEKFSPGQDKFFQWIYDCTKLLDSKYGIEIGGQELIADVSWFSCYDDGMSPNEAVDEYIEKVVSKKERKVAN